MKLSENFTLQEFTFSEYAQREGIENKPDGRVIQNLSYLCAHVLQPIRDQFGRTTILSGYRSEVLNDAVFGAKHSDHVHGCAADITCPGVDMRHVFEWLVESSLPFHQLIDAITYHNYIHIAYRHNSHRILLKDRYGRYNTHPWARREVLA